MKRHKDPNEGGHGDYSDDDGWLNTRPFKAKKQGKKILASSLSGFPGPPTPKQYLQQKKIISYFLPKENKISRYIKETDKYEKSNTSSSDTGHSTDNFPLQVLEGVTSKRKEKNVTSLETCKIKPLISRQANTPMECSNVDKQFINSMKSMRCSQVSDKVNQEKQGQEEIMHSQPQPVQSMLPGITHPVYSLDYQPTPFPSAQIELPQAAPQVAKGTDIMKIPDDFILTLDYIEMSKKEGISSSNDVVSNSQSQYDVTENFEHVTEFNFTLSDV